MSNDRRPSLPSARRVVITGAGIITPMGLGWQANSEGFRTGRLGFREISLFDTSRQRVRRAGEITLPPAEPATRLGARRRSRLDRATLLVLHAAAEAWRVCGWDQLSERERAAIPISLGTSAGAMALGEEYFRCATAVPPRLRGQPGRVHHYQLQTQGTAVAEGFGLGGPLTMISNACASGANAIGHAFQQIRSGRVTRALAGGYDALSHLVFAGFDALQALTRDVPRPFDSARDGLAIGEGAAVVALESLGSARAREAEILGEITGYGAATDIHHLTQPHPDGEAALASMSEACAVAGMGPGDVDYINSHGTGTPLNDAAEAAAIRRWCEAAGCDPSRVAVSSTKSSVGHLLGGAGAVEAVICLMAIRDGFLPPTTTVRQVDPAVTFDLVREPRTQVVRRVLTNSFGFGGANATLALAALDAG